MEINSTFDLVLASNESDGIGTIDQYQCPSFTTNEELLELISGILIGIFGCLALLANTVCILVLTNKASVKSSSNCILLAMSISDLVYSSIHIQFALYLIFAYYCIVKIYTNWLFPIVFPYYLTISNTGQVSTTYFMVFLSYERYLVICRPFQARAISTWKRSRHVCAVIMIVAVIYCLPSWWAYEPKVVAEGNEIIGYSVGSRLFSQPDFQLYYVNLGSLLVFRLIPLASLIIFSVLIYQAVQKMNRDRRNLTQTQLHDISITKILFCIVVIFVFCNVFATIRFILESPYLSLGHSLSLALVSAASNTFLMIQPVSNCIIYFILSRNFRTTLISIVHRRFS